MGPAPGLLPLGPGNLPGRGEFSMALGRNMWVVRSKGNQPRFQHCALHSSPGNGDETQATQCFPHPQGACATFCCTLTISLHFLSHPFTSNFCQSLTFSLLIRCLSCEPTSSPAPTTPASAPVSWRTGCRSDRAGTSFPCSHPWSDCQPCSFSHRWSLHETRFSN